MKQGFVAIRKLKASTFWDEVVVRAKTKGANNSANTNSAGIAIAPATGTAPAPASLTGLSDTLKIRGMMLSAKPSVTIQNGSASRYTCIGDTLRVQTAHGDVVLRCDRIEGAGVTLTEVSSGAQFQLKLR